jgi:hypothetical protein
MEIGARAPEKFPQTFGFLRRFLTRIQPPLQTLWREPAPLLKEANLMLLAGAYMRGAAPGPRAGGGERPVPRGTPPLTTSQLFEAVAIPRGIDGFLLVLLYALKHTHLLRYCANADCREPYFVGSRASQVFCSEPCAAPAQREAKRRWWDAHGEARRKTRRKLEGGKHAKAKKA